jgi:hypothetical protein
MTKTANTIKYNSLPEVLSCKICKYYTCNQKDLNKHYLTQKHIKSEAVFKHETRVEPLIPPPPPPLPPPNSPISVSSTSILICECGKKYKTDAGLLRHQTKCCQSVINAEKETETDTEIEIETKTNITEEGVSFRRKDLAISTDFKYLPDEDSELEEAEEEKYSTYDNVIINPFIMDKDTADFMHAFIYSFNILLAFANYVSKFCSFFSITNKNDA